MASVHPEESVKIQSELLLQIKILWIRAASRGKKYNKDRSSQSSLHSVNSLKQLGKTSLSSFMVYISTQLSREIFPEIHAPTPAPPQVAVTHSLSPLCPTQARPERQINWWHFPPSTARLDPSSWPLQFFFSEVLCGHLWPVSLSLRATLSLNSELPFTGCLDC